MPQAAQKQMPVSSVGPLTMRGAVSAGLRDLSSACTASNSAASMIDGTTISTTSLSGLCSRVFQNLVLNLISISARQSRIAIFGPSPSQDPNGVSLDAVLHQRVKCAPRRNGDGDAESVGNPLLNLHEAEDIRHSCARIVVDEKIKVDVASLGATSPRSENK